MDSKLGRRTFLKGALATAPLLLVGPALLRPSKAQADGTTGPSTTVEPYMLPSQVGVETIAILTVGDSIGGYRMVGIPDGLGAFRNEGRDRDFTLLMNHELGAAAGAVRAHGSKGAFVSRWTIDRVTLEVKKGEDLVQSPNDVYTWNPATSAYVQGTTVWERHCSADLPARSAFFAKDKGTKERIFMNGEEVTEGRAWARIATGPHTGEAWQLPRFGRMAYENAVASPHRQEKTIVMLTDDSSISTVASPTAFPSEVYVYIGTKQKKGNPIEQAGLTNGKLYGVKVTVNGSPVTEESNDFGFGNATTGFVGAGRFSLHNLGDVSSMNARQLEDASNAAGVARFQRCEDGAWDPRRRHRTDFYWVTTASVTSNCRLWRLRFDDVERPEAGGTIEILLKGDEGHRMLDNVTIDRWGRILMDEDPGNNGRVAKIWMYRIEAGDLIQIAEHNPKLFDPTILGNTEFLTQDEESSGLIDASKILGKGWFLFDVQVHKASSDPELVEGGQLLALFVDRSVGGEGQVEEDDDEEDDE